MSWQNPVKTARICFNKEGRILEFVRGADDNSFVGQLLEFIKEYHVVIVELENFPLKEIETLKTAKNKGGISAFARADCYSKTNPTAKFCGRYCTVNSA